jgi:hypothetical protein
MGRQVQVVQVGLVDAMARVTPRVSVALVAYLAT